MSKMTKPVVETVTMSRSFLFVVVINVISCYTRAVLQPLATLNARLLSAQPGQTRMLVDPFLWAVCKNDAIFECYSRVGRMPSRDNNNHSNLVKKGSSVEDHSPIQ